MRYYKLVLPFVILILGTNTIVAPAQSSADAMRIFRQFSDDFIGRYKAENREQVLKLGNGWVKMSFEPIETSVSNTILLLKDSLAIPYVGVLQFAVIRHFTASHQTKEDAEKDNDFSEADSWTHRYTFTYQNAAWVAEAKVCEQGERWVLEDRQSGRNPKAKFGFHDCSQGEG